MAEQSFTKEPILAYSNTPRQEMVLNNESRYGITTRKVTTFWLQQWHQRESVDWRWAELLPGCSEACKVPIELLRFLIDEPELETVEAEEALDCELAEPRRTLDKTGGCCLKVFCGFNHLLSPGKTKWKHRKQQESRVPLWLTCSEGQSQCYAVIEVCTWHWTLIWDHILGKVPEIHWH